MLGGLGVARAQPAPARRAAPAVQKRTPPVEAAPPPLPAPPMLPGPELPPAPVLPQMTLAQALDYARAHQPSLQAAQARIEVARRGVAVARAEWLPQLAGTAQLFGGTMNNSTAMFLGGRAVDLPRIGASQLSADPSLTAAYPSTLVAVGLRQTLLDFGRIAAQAAVSDLEARVGAYRAADEQLEVALQVEGTYYAVLAARAVERAASDAYQRAKLRRDMVKASVDRGLRPPIDLTRVEADLMRFDVGRTRARGGIETAQATFAAAVGAPSPLLDAAELAPAAPGERTDLPPLSEALVRVVEQSPAVRAALTRLLQQQAITRATTMQWVPSLQLTATVSGRAGGAPGNAGPSGSSGYLPEVGNWDVGVVLSLPLFDGTILARRAQSRAQEEVIRQEVGALRLQLLAAVQRAYTGFRVASATLPALQASADAARRNYDQASARFRAGLSSNLELADAEALRTDAEIQLAVGRFDIARARAAFSRAVAQGL